MWPNSFWPGSYWPASYWPKVGGLSAVSAPNVILDMPERQTLDMPARMTLDMPRGGS